MLVAEMMASLLFPMFKIARPASFIMPRKSLHPRNASGFANNIEPDPDGSLGVLPLRPLYPTHIQTTLWQKGLLTVGSAFMSLANPYRDDMVAVLGETTGHNGLEYMHAKMKSHPVGQEILRDRPLINSTTIDLEYLKRLPETTFGYTYWRFLHDNKVTPDSRQPVHFVDEPELAYVMKRYREIHDLVHTLLGMPTNMIGEVAVKWVEAIQTRLPMCIGGAIFGPLRLKPGQRKKYVSTYLPWAIECGQTAKFLMNVYFEKQWETPVDELRKQLAILPPP